MSGSQRSPNAIGGSSSSHSPIPPSGSPHSKTIGPSSSETSYVNMADVDNRLADVSLTGNHCQYEYCGQLDFLPFFCQSCRKTFCLDHRSETAHHCANEGAWAARRRQAQQAKLSAGADRTMRDYVTQKPCASSACKTVVGTSLVPGVHCSNCNRDYCLKHRLREDHNCANLQPIGARSGGSAMADSAARAKSALDKLRAWGAAKKEQANKALPRPAAQQSATARMAALADLKRTAKGDAKVPAEMRLYLHVEAEAASTQAKIPKGKFYYQKDWVVGRILDAAARNLQIPNINNQSSKEEDKLRIFFVEGGRLLEFNEQAGKVLANGNTIVLLRGVGPPPELIDF
ncbi:hypothetical protein SEPCBS57363_003924 [Sporothrix epigloea]|uniref:AN1-type domain-containing protein n=1 Tax=Sporothrix epigloea TaxID=1892477 RepID=A0ABP0DS28_9PEZI